jgi:hypothetical protein
MNARCVIPLAFLMALASCSKRITNRNLEQVHADMSIKEVESILGQPTRTLMREIESPTQKRTASAVTYYYEQDGHTVELHFVNDKLAEGGKIGLFGE